MAKQRFYLWRSGPDAEWQYSDPFAQHTVPGRIEILELMSVAEHREILHEFNAANRSTMDMLARKLAQAEGDVVDLRLAAEMRDF